MSYEKGQSLIELVVAIGIFVIIVSSLASLIFNSYNTGRLASEITQASFLAEEGIEAARSIRDNSWNDLLSADGEYGLDNSLGNWRFIPGSEVIDGKFTRVIKVEEIDFNRKKITSKVTWQFIEGKTQEVKLVTYLTNWAEPMPSYLAQLHYRWRADDGRE